MTLATIDVFEEIFRTQSLCTAEIIAILRFFSFRNKARNPGYSRKNAGDKLKCRISRTIAGQLTPMSGGEVDTAPGTGNSRHSMQLHFPASLDIVGWNHSFWAVRPLR